MIDSIAAQIKVKNYLVSEKLDGVRGYWNGNQMLTKSGNVINLPKWFTKDFPRYPIDGELWAGRNTFEFVSGVIRRKLVDQQDLQKIKFMVFDLPSSKAAFLVRYQQMLSELSNKSIYLEVISQVKYNSLKEIYTKLDAVVFSGGEGLMLHRQDALYRAGKNHDLIKLKPYFDAEAEVIGYTEGKGKYVGMLGALRVRTPEGIIFSIGSGFSDKQRRLPPPIGSRITYQYHGHTKNGVPKFAIFLRVRPLE